jgi:hypothetical protein
MLRCHRPKKSVPGMIIAGIRFFDLQAIKYVTLAM